MIDVSIIVAAHNAEATIEACLGALLRQDYAQSRLEIILVDNASTDATSALARQHPGVHLLFEPKRGAYVARNRGLKKARGDLVAFTDADCIANEDWISRLIAAMSDPRLKVVMGRDRPSGSSKGVTLLGRYDHLKEDFVMNSDDARIYYAHTNNLMTCKSLLDEMGGFDERPRGADVIFVQRVLEQYGTTSVGYLGAGIVNHTEIVSSWSYLKKAFIYGRSLRNYSNNVCVRALRNSERMRVFQRVVGDYRLSKFDALYLLALLGVGVAVYGCGWLCGGQIAAKPGTGVEK